MSKVDLPTPAAAAQPATLSSGGPGPALRPPAREPDHPHENLDRVARATVARLTGGVSAHAFLGAW